jgi:acyl-coenzyme A synthetase/AMP-(fatty) acid ligase
VTSLRARLAQARPAAEARLEAPSAALALRDLAARTGVRSAADIAQRNVLVRTASQSGAAQALVELDGLARRLVLCPPDLEPEHLPYVLRAAEVDLVLTDAPDAVLASLGVPVERLAAPAAVAVPGPRATEWLLFTSGTTGPPKMVAHTLASLTAATPPPGRSEAVWATFYDIRRYGGLQVLLRALTGGCPIALSDPDEALPDQTARFARFGVTHLTGTPSHWRRLLMWPQAAAILRPDYIRLSGEIADQAVLDGLKAAFPNSSVGHAYASTEAGVGFAVNDGLEGFPADYLGNRNGVEMKVVDGSLRIRSTRTAHAYIGRNAGALTDDDGFVDSGDIVELRGDRYYFVGRRGGIINIGGLKVHPEEIEAVINRHPDVRMSRAKSRKSPITGGIVVADVILADGTDQARVKEIRDQILAQCRAQLASHKVPAVIRFVEALDVTPAGKLARTDAS